MKWNDVLSALPGSCLMGNVQPEITGICLDSRKAQPGSLYVCIPGTRQDGHTYAPQAVQAGAAALVVERFLPEVACPQVKVADARLALAQVSAAYWGYPAQGLTLVAVTGTNGKTTTTHMIKHILECQGHKVGMMGTVANYIGTERLPQNMTTPDPPELYALLAQMRDAGCTYAVMEASAHALALRKLEGLHFAAGVFTNLTQDHLDDFHTMDNYAAAKALLFEDARCDTAILWGDDPAWKQMIRGRRGRTLTYGRGIHADLQATACQVGLEHLAYALSFGGTHAQIAMPVGGSFNVENSMAAAAVCLQVGVSLPAVAKALGHASPVPGRIQHVPLDKPYTVVVDYAHTPDGILSILQTLKPLAKGKLTIVFGCGGNRDTTKRPIMGEIASRLADNVVITSDNPRFEDPEAIMDMIEPGVQSHSTPYVRIADRREAIAYAMGQARAGDVILIAGKGHEDYQEIRGVKMDFDDCQIVQALAADAE